MRRPTPPSAAFLLAALRRFLVFFVAAAAAAALVGLFVAAAGHESFRRGLAVGFYITGAGLAAFGILLGSRPPVRARGARFSGGVRWATSQEHREAMNVPALFVAIGILLLPIGIAVDTKH
ncbi:MAG TPA: hypothetical protein VLW49_07185 [Gaiellaceae bacterium]|nr:hypothetical protein [Gaiellaceae bacterium]